MRGGACRQGLGLAGLLASLLLACPARAQRWETGPPASRVAPPDVRAVASQPAGLPHIGPVGLRTSLWMPLEQPDGGRLGWAAQLGGAVRALGLGGAVGVAYARDAGRQGLLWRAGMGASLGRRLSAGLGYAWRWASLREGQGSGSLLLGLSWRPSSRWAASLALREVDELGSWLGGFAVVPPEAELGVALRPTGGREATVEVRGAADLDGGWRASGLVELQPLGHGAWQLAGGVRQDVGGELQWWAGLGMRWPLGGATWELGVGADGGRPYGQLAATLGGWRPASVLEDEGFVYAVDVHRRLGPRELTRLVLRLERARREPAARALWLRLRGTGLRWAGAQELRHAIAAWRAGGRKVACHLDDASGPEWYACVAADRVWVDPSGGARLVGPAMESLYLGGLLERLGLRADFVRTGAYKTAPEPLERRAPSPASARQRSWLLRSVLQRVVADVAADRGLSRHAALEAVTAGPWLAEELLERGLADALVDPYHPRQALADLAGRPLPLRRSLPARPPRRWGPEGQVAVLVVDGTLTEGRNLDVPLLDVHTSGARTLVRTIERLAADPSVRAVVLRVDSPGGSALASDQIWRALRRLAARKPLLASLGPTAASGGYFVASAAERLWVLPSGWTGSIGVVYGKVEASQLLQRLGIGLDARSVGPHAGLGSPFRPFSAAQRRMLREKVDRIYGIFLERVAEGRRMPRGRVAELASGRVYTGDQATALGLTDAVGGLTAVLDAARRRAGLPADAPVLVVPRRPSGLLEMLLGSGEQAAARTVLRAAVGSEGLGVAFALALQGPGAYALASELPVGP